MMEPVSSTLPRLNVIDAKLQLARQGLNRGAAGNVSVRWRDGFLITPSGVAPEDLHPEDIAHVTLEGEISGRKKPSSEWRMHRDIYVARPAANAVIHCHAPFCVALAVHQRSIPSYHYMVAAAGGKDIRCSPYATFGSQELSVLALKALQDRQACLLGNHGMMAIGGTLKKAMNLALEVEELAEGYWRALQIGEPIILSDAEMDIVLKRFKTYGDNAQVG